MKTLQDFYREYRAGCNPITGEPNLFKNLTDEMIWNNAEAVGRLAALEQIEREVEAEREKTMAIIGYVVPFSFWNGRKDGLDAILAIIRRVKGGTK